MNHVKLDTPLEVCIHVYNSDMIVFVRETKKTNATVHNISCIRINTCISEMRVFELANFLNSRKICIDFCLHLPKRAIDLQTSY